MTQVQMPGDAVLRFPRRSQGLIWDVERGGIFCKTEYPADRKPAKVSRDAA